MLKIKFQNVTKLSINELLLFLYSIPKSKCHVHCRNYSRTNEKVTPVKLAYSSYESTDVDSTNNNQKCPVVIMHGLLGSKNNWNSLSKSIHSRTKKKVIAVDARNHGDSPQTPEFNYRALVEDIRYLLTDLDIPKINAIGHSMGGRAMMLLALKYPHLINSLIVVDISPIRTSPAIIDLTLMFDAMRSIKLENNIPLSKARKNVEQQLMETVPDTYIRQFLLTNLVEVEGGKYKWRVNLEALINNFSSIVQFKPPNTKFKGPVLFIGGRKSTFLKEEDHKGILQLFPKSEFKYIDDAGHWVHSEKPVEFLNLVSNFLNKVD